MTMDTGRLLRFFGNAAQVEALEPPDNASAELRSSTLHTLRLAKALHDGPVPKEALKGEAMLTEGDAR